MTSLRGDDQAAFPVFEAVLVAIMILTAIMFMTALQSPSGGRDQGGIDLGVMAADTLTILEDRRFVVAGSASCATAPGCNLNEWVTAVMEGDDKVGAAIDAFIDEVLPPGTRYVVRVDNGFAPMHILPWAEERAPLAGRAATTYLVPTWDHNAGAGTEEVWPGMEIQPATAADVFATAPCVEGPMSATTGVGPGLDWAGVWAASPGRVPTDIPFGAWEALGAGCSGSLGIVNVGLPSGSEARPVYGVEMVVWNAI